MRPLVALWFVGLAASWSGAAAQDDAEAEPCRHGCDDEEVVAAVPRRPERSVPVSLIATGMLSRRSALENNFMRFGRSVMPAPGAARSARADNFMRFGRSAAAAPGAGADGERVARGGEHNSNGFIRFGRAKAQKDNYVRFGRAGGGGGSSSSGARDDNYVRFGRPDRQSNFVRFGRDPSNFVRFGRDPGSNFVRFGRDPSSNFVRFGRDPSSNFVRFGRDPSSNFVRFGRAGEVEGDVEDQDEDVQREGRSKDNYMRFGRAESGDGNATEKDSKRAKDSFVRFGRGGGGGSSSASNFVRFGRSYVDEEDSTEGEAIHQELQDGGRPKRPHVL